MLQCPIFSKRKSSDRSEMARHFPRDPRRASFQAEGVRRRPRDGQSSLYFAGEAGHPGRAAGQEKLSGLTSTPSILSYSTSPDDFSLEKKVNTPPESSTLSSLRLGLPSTIIGSGTSDVRGRVVSASGSGGRHPTFFGTQGRIGLYCGVLDPCRCGDTCLRGPSYG